VIILINDLSNMTDVFSFIQEYWWQLLIALIVAITLIVMIVKYILDKTMIFVFKGIVFVVTLPFKFMIRFPIISFILILGLATYLLLR